MPAKAASGWCLRQVEHRIVLQTLRRSEVIHVKGDRPCSTLVAQGRWILFQSGRRGINSLLVVSADGSTTSFLTSAKEEAEGGRWSPNGDEIVYVTQEKEYFSGRLKLLKFDDRSGQPAGEPITLYTAPVDRGGGWAIRGAVWSPDGKTLATVLQNSGWNHIYLLSPKGGEPRQITDGSFEDENPTFSPDGKSISFVSNRGLLEANNLWLNLR
jgi:Tol biopolymer transport system component